MTGLAYIVAAVIFIVMLTRVLRLTIDLKKLKRQVAAECQHAWSPWETKREHPVHSEGKRIGFLKVQERQCALCGFVEFSQYKIEP